MGVLGGCDIPFLQFYVAQVSQVSIYRLINLRERMNSWVACVQLAVSLTVAPWRIIRRLFFCI